MCALLHNRQTHTNCIQIICMYVRVIAELSNPLASHSYPLDIPLPVTHLHLHTLALRHVCMQHAVRLPNAYTRVRTQRDLVRVRLVFWGRFRCCCVASLYLFAFCTYIQASRTFPAFLYLHCAIFNIVILVELCAHVFVVLVWRFCALFAVLAVFCAFLYRQLSLLGIVRFYRCCVCPPSPFFYLVDTLYLCIFACVFVVLAVLSLPF